MDQEFCCAILVQLNELGSEIFSCTTILILQTLFDVFVVGLTR
jgi:hypothetical protein